MGTVLKWRTDIHAGKTHVHIKINLSKKMKPFVLNNCPPIYFPPSLSPFQLSNFCLVSMLILLLLHLLARNFWNEKARTVAVRSCFSTEQLLGENSFTVPSSADLASVGHCALSVGSLTSCTQGRWQGVPPNMTCLCHSLFRISSSETHWQDLKGDLAYEDMRVMMEVTWGKHEGSIILPQCELITHKPCI